MNFVKRILTGVLFLTTTAACHEHDMEDSYEPWEPVCASPLANHSLKVELQFYKPIPHNILFGFNNLTPDIDECLVDNPYYLSNLYISPDRTRVTIRQNLTANHELYLDYFDFSDAPLSDLISVQLYSRKRCDQPIRYMGSVEPLEIKWAKSEITGYCSYTSYKGRVEYIE